MTNRFESFDGLIDLMDRLREPDGCPWDREQNYETLRGYLLEEAYEVVEALDDQDEEALCEELGDLLFQIVFLSRIGKENGSFSARDVVRGIATKMIRRHPHVFGDQEAGTSEEVLRNWEQIKKRERKEKLPPGAGGPHPGILDGIPRALPALQKAQRIGTKTARAGFFWKNSREILGKVHEELGELIRALGQEDKAAVGEELGDLLFTLVMLAGKEELDAEGSLEHANRKFSDRFRMLEELLAAQGESLENSSPERLEELWREVKESGNR